MADPPIPDPQPSDPHEAEGSASPPRSTPDSSAGATSPAATVITTDSPVDPPAPEGLSKQVKLALVAVAAVALVALFFPRGDGSFEAPGGFLYEADGRPAVLGERFAPVTLVHFWSTWCPPCIDEIPSLFRLAEADAASEEYALLMVAVDDEVDKVEGFLGSRSATALYDPSWEVAHRYGTRKLPETYLLVEGRVVDKFVGAQDWDDPEIRRRLAEKVAPLRPDGPTFGTAP